MSTTIQIKRSSTASGVPLSTDLAVGELAVNLADKRLFTKQSDGTIIELSTNPTDLDAATLRIDGVEITASATELNSLDGFTGSTAELNTLDGLTATTIELNTLDGITASTAELNKLDGYTGSTAELNILDGVTATTAELNFVDGVTSNIQAQLDSKADLSGASFTGDVDVTGAFSVDGVDEAVGITAGTFGVIGSNTTSGGTGATSVVLGAFVDESNEYFVSLNRGGEQKLKTTATGVDITGTAEVDGLSIGGTAITATAAELNYTDGVTSNIQTQLDGKATTAQGALADSAVQPDDNVSFGTGSFSGAVDVTGTVTADGLTVDTGGTAVILNHSATGPTLRFNNLDQTVADGQQLARIEFSTDDGGSTTDEAYLQLTATGGGGAADFDIMVGDGTPVKRARFGVGGDVSFYEDTGTTAKFVWDASAESLGIGRANPRASLDFGIPTLSSTLSTTLSDYQVMLEAPSGTGNYAHNIGWSESTGSAVTVASINAVDDGSSSATGITFATGDNSSITERMRIDSSGNVGIGTASPSAALDIYKPGDGNDTVMKIQNSGYNSANTSGKCKLQFGWANHIGASIVANKEAVNRTGFIFNRELGFNTEAEGMRLDSLGNLLVGQTSPSNNSAGFYCRPSSSSGFIADGAAALTMGRLNSDGVIASFIKDGSAVGSIGSRASVASYFVLDPRTGGSGITGSLDAILPTNNAGVPSDGANSIGSGSHRFKDLYLSGEADMGTARINTTGTVYASYEKLSILGSGDNHAGVGIKYGDSAGHGIGIWNTSASGSMIKFSQGASGTGIGSITHNTSSVSYNTSSDYRLKENVVSMDNASERVKALKPCRFNFIADPDTTVDGFIAHEAQEVVPEAVHGTKDGMRTEEYEVTPAVLDDDGNIIEEAVMGTREVPDYQGIDQSKLVPLLTKALQEALERIEALEAKL